jgi:hypothetical protein
MAWYSVKAQGLYLYLTLPYIRKMLVYLSISNINLYITYYITGFWLGGPKVRDHWEDLGVGGRITLRWTLGKEGSMGQTRFGWLRIGSNGGLL